jgi:hypothetical protein
MKIHPERSCETTPKWHGFLMIKLAAQAASGRAEQRTAEYRISNRRISKDGFAALSLFLNRQNTSLRHSIFMIRYSIFAFLKFLFRSDWTLAARGGAYMRLRVVEQRTAEFLFRSDRPFFLAGGWADI